MARPRLPLPAPPRSPPSEKSPHEATAAPSARAALDDLVKALARSAATEVFAGRRWTPRSKQRGAVTTGEFLIVMALQAIAAAALILLGGW